MVNLGGTFERVPDDATRDERGRGLDAREYSQMKDQRIYLRATDGRNAK